MDIGVRGFGLIEGEGPRQEEREETEEVGLFYLWFHHSSNFSL